MISRPRRRRGFSLVEILLLVSMTCIVSTTYFLFVTGNKDEVEDLYLRTQAMLAAQQTLEEARYSLTHEPLSGFRPRHLEIDKMSGTLEVAPYPERPSMYQVTVTVRWGTRTLGPEHRLVLTQLLRDRSASRPPAAGGVPGVTN